MTDSNLERARNTTQAGWRGLSTSDRRTLWIALVLLLLAAVVRPVWTAADPETAVDVALAERTGQEHYYWHKAYEREGLPVDPWGREFRETYRTYGERTVGDTFYSVGPNGLDENGSGDDFSYPGVRTPHSPVTVGFTWAREILAGGAVVLLGWWFGIALLAAPRSKTLTVEFARALALALPPVTALLGALVLAANFFHWPRVLIDFATEPMAHFQLHPLVGLAGLLFALTYLLALGYRLKDPSDAEPGSPTSPLSKLVFGGAVVLLALAPLAKPVWRLASARMQAVEALRGQRAELDPWGTPWCTDGNMDGSTWSAGPNQLDEGQAGDDITLIWGPFYPPTPDQIYLKAPVLLVGLALNVLALWGTWLGLVAPRVRRRREALFDTHAKPPHEREA